MSHAPGPFDALDERLADERTQLLAFLDDSRAESVETIEGLTDEQARRRLVPSLTSPLSILKHLVYVEQNWFHSTLAGRTRAEVGIAESAEDAWPLTEEDTVSGLTADFHRVCEEARAIVAGYDLDHRMVHRRLGEVTLRFVVVHVIREHSRHAGHADILREQILAADATDATGARPPQA